MVEKAIKSEGGSQGAIRRAAAFARAFTAHIQKLRQVRYCSRTHARTAGWGVHQSTQNAVHIVSKFFSLCLGWAPLCTTRVNPTAGTVGTFKITHTLKSTVWTYFVWSTYLGTHLLC